MLSKFTLANAPSNEKAKNESKNDFFNLEMVLTL